MDLAVTGLSALRPLTVASAPTEAMSAEWIAEIVLAVLADPIAI